MKNNLNSEITRREFIGTVAGAAAGLYGLSFPKKSSAKEQKTELEGKVEELSGKYKAAIEGGKITFNGYEELTKIIVGKKGINAMLKDPKYTTPIQPKYTTPIQPKLDILKEDVLTAIYAYLKEGQVSLGFYYSNEEGKSRSLGMKLDGTGIDQQIISNFNPIKLRKLLGDMLNEEGKEIYQKALKRATTEFINVNTAGEWDYNKQEKYWTKLPNTHQGLEVAMLLLGDQKPDGKGRNYFMNLMGGAEIQIILPKEVKYTPPLKK